MRFLFALMIFLASSRAAAHAVAVDMDAFVEGKQLVVLMNGTGGQPINGAKLEYLLENPAGTRATAFLTQAADGEYRVTAPSVAAGAYTLTLRDTTFPGEALEARQQVTYPLVSPVRLVLPPSAAGAPSIPVLVLLTIAPIALSLIVVVFILLSRPKPSPQPLEDTP
jgi:hypothetical protein